MGGKCIAPSPGYNEVVQQFEQPVRESFEVYKQTKNHILLGLCRNLFVHIIDTRFL